MQSLVSDFQTDFSVIHFILKKEYEDITTLEIDKYNKNNLILKNRDRNIITTMKVSNLENIVYDYLISEGVHIEGNVKFIIDSHRLSNFRMVYEKWIDGTAI